MEQETGPCLYIDYQNTYYLAHYIPIYKELDFLPWLHNVEKELGKHFLKTQCVKALNVP